MSEDAIQPEISWGQALPFWWAFVWRCTVGSLVVGFTVSVIAGVVTGAAGRTDLSAPIAIALSYLGSVPVSMYAMKVVLAKFAAAPRA